MSSTTIDQKQNIKPEESKVETQQQSTQRETQPLQTTTKPPIPTVYPPNQPTIIIGPNSIRAVPNPGTQGSSAYLNAQQIYPSLGSSFNRRLRDSLLSGDKSLRQGGPLSMDAMGNMGSNPTLQEIYAARSQFANAQGFDDEDEDDDDEIRVGQYFNDLDFYTWDLVIKNTPKLPQLELLFHKNSIKNKKFFTVQNECQYNPPFMIFYSKKPQSKQELAAAKQQQLELQKQEKLEQQQKQQQQNDEQMKEGSANINTSTLAAENAQQKIAQVQMMPEIGSFNEQLLIPHQCELKEFYENFHLLKYPREPILMLKRKFFMVQYEVEAIHAIDGLGMGIVIIPVNKNFLIKVYNQSYTPTGSAQSESYQSVVKPLLELAAVFSRC